MSSLCDTSPDTALWIHKPGRYHGLIFVPTFVFVHSSSAEQRNIKEPNKEMWWECGFLEKAEGI